MAAAEAEAGQRTDNVGEPEPVRASDGCHTAREADGGDGGAGVEVGCAQCGEQTAKYRCPRCQVRTCSLKCCQDHKVETGCTGKRDRTGYVSIKEFDDRTLSSDYVFLEDAMRLKDNAKRSRPPTPRDELPHHLSTLVHQARRRQVELLLQAPGMARRKANTTRFDWKKKAMFWKVEWSFLKSDVSCTDTRVDEKAKLSEVLGKHLALQPGQAARHHALREYSEAGLDSLTVLLKKERCPANAPEYYALNLQSTLEEQLTGKTVIEFPVLLVVLPGDASSYAMVHSSQVQQAGGAGGC